MLRVNGAISLVFRGSEFWAFFETIFWKFLTKISCPILAKWYTILTNSAISLVFLGVCFLIIFQGNFSGDFGWFLWWFFGTIILTCLSDYSGDFYEMRYRFTNFYLSFSIAKESARVNGAISSVFLGVCRTKRLSNAQTTHFFTRSWEPSKNSYLTILIYMTQKKEEKKWEKGKFI